MSDNQTVGPSLSALASSVLKFSPTAWLKSWLLYLGIETHVRGTIEPSMKPLHSVCEYLHALHIYTDEARRGEVRTVSAHHFCSHVTKEYMIPKSRYLALDPEEQKLWHSHEFEVKSGMLVLPYPETHRQGKKERDAWDKLETQAMDEVVGLYGKLYHFWQVDQGHELPLGQPKLMGSLTDYKQLDLDQAMETRNEAEGINQSNKRELRKGIPLPGIPQSADNWWKEAERTKIGIYAD
ncbi:hypothetical protein B0A52_09089 [Exophiala mesophila]|uniref:DUF1264 domain-containing protein n=1 Tax=Exophiala mesophila TaxID=212818 RepID=A0A438MWJ6_EXOME|nr:hypothetical protein B0A52_09089 [Exophiala mesophila]